MGALDKIKNLFTINYEDFDDDLYGDEYYDDVEDTKAIKKAAKAKKSKYDYYQGQISAYRIILLKMGVRKL